MGDSVMATEQASALIERLRAAGAEHARGSSQEGFGRAGRVIVLIEPAGLRALSTEPTGDTEIQELLRRLREKNFSKGEQRVGAGGLAATLMRACAGQGTGFELSLSEEHGDDVTAALFRERSAAVLVTCWPSAHLALANFVDRSGRFTGEAIGRVTAGEVRVRWMGATVLATEMRALQEDA